MPQYSTTVRNARLDAIESTIGTAPTIEVFTGSPPANCAAADSGTKLVDEVLPSDWMSNAASGVKALLGTWQNNAVATGTPGHFRIKQGATCHMQGTAGVGSGELSFDGTITSGQQVTVSAFNITEGNA